MGKSEIRLVFDADQKRLEEVSHAIERELCNNHGRGAEDHLCETPWTIIAEGPESKHVLLSSSSEFPWYITDLLEVAIPGFHEALQQVRGGEV